MEGFYASASAHAWNIIRHMQAAGERLEAIQELQMRIGPCRAGDDGATIAIPTSLVDARLVAVLSQLPKLPRLARDGSPRTIRIGLVGYAAGWLAERRGPAVCICLGVCQQKLHQHQPVGHCIQKPWALGALAYPESRARNGGAWLASAGTDRCVTQAVREERLSMGRQECRGRERFCAYGLCSHITPTGSPADTCDAG